MLVFWKEKLVFLAVPKTGTTAFEEALSPRAAMIVNDPPELKHAPLFRYNRFFRPMLEKFGGEGFETLAVMREPVSWLGSWYRYRQRPFLDGKPTSTKGLSFDGFVQDYCRDDRPRHADVGSQANFLEPRRNGVKVDHLFAYENQAALIQFLQNRLQVSLDVPRRNESPQGDTTLSSGTTSLLRHHAAADFNLWEGILNR